MVLPFTRPKSFLICSRVLLLLVFLMGGGTLPVWGQPASPPKPDSLQKVNLPRIAAGLGLTYTAGLFVMSRTWYRQSERTSFHFFNDNREWQQLDKAGHLWGAFHESRLGVNALRAAGVAEKKAVIYGGMLGFVLQSPIELLDGYVADYGASAGDLGANAVGSAALILQELAWQEVRLLPKFSFHRTSFANLRPQVLGKGLHEELLKDYNGQTYWLAADVGAFLPAASRYPRWLNLAVGYGANGMVYGAPDTNRAQGFRHNRQFFLALDWNPLAIKTRSKVLKKVFWVMSMVHLPAPAVEYTRRQGLKFHTLYF